MKKIFLLVLFVFLFFLVFSGCDSHVPPVEEGEPEGTTDATGPAPNSGDGISDGSGLETPVGHGLSGAPNSGDGLSDSSGWE